MAVKGIPYKLKEDNLYTSDFGVPASFNLSLRPPSDLSDQQINDILECIGAERRETSRVICSERGLITYRRFRFYRTNGSSMTIVAPDRANLLKHGQCIWDILKGSTSMPVCAELIGEQHVNVLDDLTPDDRDNSTEGPPLKPGSGAGRNRYFYFGTMSQYKSDTGLSFGVPIPLPFKTDSDLDNEPYSGLKTEITGCVKNVIKVSICGGAQNTREYRRFIPTLITTVAVVRDGEMDADEQVAQTLTIPCAEHTAADIRSCGIAIAKKGFVKCLRYEGESNKRYHKLFSESNNG